MSAPKQPPIIPDPRVRRRPAPAGPRHRDHALLGAGRILAFWPPDRPPRRRRGQTVGRSGPLLDPDWTGPAPAAWRAQDSATRSPSRRAGLRAAGLGWAWVCLARPLKDVWMSGTEPSGQRPAKRPGCTVRSTQYTEMRRGPGNLKSAYPLYSLDGPTAGGPTSGPDQTEWADGAVRRARLHFVRSMWS